MMLRSALAIVATAFIAPTAYSGVVDPDLPTLRDCPLPSSVEKRWRNALGDPDRALVRLLRAYRHQDPRFQMTEPPPKGVKLVPDFAPMETLHVVVPIWEDHRATYSTMLREATQHGRVQAAVMMPDEIPTVRANLAADGVDLSKIDIVGPIDTIWMRDFGPVPVETPEGRGVVDFHYAIDCVDNDLYPTSSRKEAQPVWRSSMYVEGGNLMTDGMGTCFATEGLLDNTQLDEFTLEAQLTTWLGCERLVMLEPLVGTVIDHVDMMLTPAPDGTLLIAAFHPEQDRENHDIMTRNRRLLEQIRERDGLHWNIVDLPTPPSLPRENGPLVRTWNNLLPFNGAVFVPSYAGSPAELQARAHQRIKEAFPGRKLVEVPSDALIEYQGAVHCIARAE